MTLLTHTLHAYVTRGVPEIECHIRRTWHAVLSTVEHDFEILSVNDFLERDPLLFDMYRMCRKNV